MKRVTYVVIVCEDGSIHIPKDDTGVMEAARKLVECEISE